MRKRIRMAAVCAALVVSVTGCSASGDMTAGGESSSAQESVNPQETKPEETTPEETRPEETTEESVSEETGEEESSGESASGAVTADSSAEEIANALWENASSLSEYTLMNMPVDLTNPDDVSYNLGLSSADGLEGASVVSPAMTSVALSIAVVKTEEGADAAEIKQALFDNANPAKWICVTAEKVYAVQSDLGILIVMAPEEVCQDVLAVFEDMSGEMTGETLSRDGEVGGGIVLPM